MATTSLPPSAVASSSTHAVVASGSTVHLLTGDKVASASSAADAKAELAGVIRNVALSADGKYAVTAGDDKSLRVWELKEKPELVSTRQTTKRVADMCFDNDGNIVVTDKVGDVFSYPFEPRAVENRPQGFVVASDPSLNPDGDLLLGHVSLITQTLLTPDGKHIITADRDEHIRVSRYPKAYVIDRFLWGSEGFVSAIHIPSTRPNLLLSGGGQPTLQVFDWTTGSLLGRIDILSAVSPYRAVRPPTRKIKGKRKAVGSGSGIAPSDDPATAGWFTAPEGHMYPIGQGIAITQIGSIEVDGKTVVLFYSRGSSALHAFTLNEDGTAGEVKTVSFAHPVLGFAQVGDKILVTLDNTHAAIGPATTSTSPVALVSVAADGSLAPSDSPITSSLSASLSTPELQIPESEAGKLNLYGDLQILPRWPGFEEDEAQAGESSLPANVDELAPKRLGRLKAQGHDVHIPAKKRKKSKAEKKRERAANAKSGGETSEVATGDDEESAMNA